MPDERARFEEIYRAHAPAILAYAARRVGRPDDAADVLADTFTVAWRRIDDVPAGDEARLWLYGVARRCVHNQRRGRRRRARLEARLGAQIAGLVGAATVTTPPAAPAALGAEVVAAFNALSDSDRELLTLLAWDGLDRDDVATVMGWSRARVRVRLHRARARLLRRLGADPAAAPAQPSASASAPSSREPS